MEVKDVPESDQGQSTFEVGPTSWTGAGVVADSEQPELESNPPGNKADLAETEKRLAAVLVSVTASKNSSAHVTADQEVSVMVFAEELRVLADTTHVLGSETRAVERQRIRCFRCAFSLVCTRRWTRLIAMMSWRKPVRRKRNLKLRWQCTLPSLKQLFRHPASQTEWCRSCRRTSVLSLHT